MLLRFVEPEVADPDLHGRIIEEEEEVETIPDKVSALCLDEIVCLLSCWKYSSNDAWKFESQVVDTKKTTPHGTANVVLVR